MLEFFIITVSLFLTIICIASIMKRISEEKFITKLERQGGSNRDAVVSVIIPARNEEKTISRCIEAVLNQEGVKKEVIVVDDASEDDTSSVVISNYLSYGVRLIRIGSPREGWVGKSWTCHRGYLESSGDWLLFIDADASFNDRYVVSDTLAYATHNGIDALSLIPMLDTSSLASKAMLPTLTALMYLLTPPRRSNDPNDKLAFFYGSYMLFRRDVYESVGGHAAVRDHILEDKSLGELTKSRGFRVLLLDGRERMRAKFNETFNGYLNALLRLFTEYAVGAGVRRILKYLLAGLIFMLLPVALALYGIFMETLTLASILSIIPLLLIFFIQAFELKRLRAPIYYFPLVILSVLIILYALLSVALRYRLGGVNLNWRGRTYRYGGASIVKKEVTMVEK
ncbi:MAG: glycosyltransferase family 2 protein [Nitrososphaerota archaeon]